MKHSRIGLAVGGGGVRSFAGLGVIKVCEDSGLKFSAVSGTSFGSVIASLYSFYNNAADVEEKIRSVLTGKDFEDLIAAFKENKLISNDERLRAMDFSYKYKDIFRPDGPKPASTATFLIERKIIDDIIQKLIPDVNIEDLSLPFVCTAVDLISAETIVFDHGSLRQAVMASISVPGIFQPVGLDGYLLVDGGIAGSTPVRELIKMGAGYNIAVDVNSNISIKEEYRDGIDIHERSLKISEHKLNEEVLSCADMVLRPQVKDIFWADFTRISYCYKAGIESAAGLISALNE